MTQVTKEQLTPENKVDHFKNYVVYNKYWGLAAYVLTVLSEACIISDKDLEDHIAAYQQFHVSEIYKISQFTKSLLRKYGQEDDLTKWYTQKANELVYEFITPDNFPARTGQDRAYQLRK